MLLGPVLPLLLLKIKTAAHVVFEMVTDTQRGQMMELPSCWPEGRN